MNNKGQALIEFILILPLFLMIMFVIVDFGIIFNAKNKLENDSHDIVEFISNYKDIDSIRKIYPDLKINLTIGSDYKKLVIATEVDLITPGLNRILDDPYPIEIVRSLPND